jgi:hypothetical protein
MRAESAVGVKKQTEVIYPQLISLSNTKEYQIKCVGNHIGNTIGSGHYTSYIKKENVWLSTNDTIVKIAKNKDLKQKRQNAYGLVYLRSRSAPPEAENVSATPADDTSDITEEDANNTEFVSHRDDPHKMTDVPSTFEESSDVLPDTGVLQKGRNTIIMSFIN